MLIDRCFSSSFLRSVLLHALPSLLLFCAGRLVAGDSPVPAPEQRPIKLNDIHGVAYTPLAPEHKTPGLMFFVDFDAAETEDFIPEINRIYQDYSPRVAIYVVHSSARSMRTFDLKQKAAAFDVAAPVLLDRSLRLARRLQSSVRPEAVVVAPGGRVLYQGRINDLYLAPGKRQQAATTQDLRTALDAILSGKPVPAPQPAAQGSKIMGIMRGESYLFPVQVVNGIAIALFFGALLVAFIRGLRLKLSGVILLPWAMMVLSYLCWDMFVPLVASRCYGQAAPEELFPETPGTIAMVFCGWLPGIIFHMIGLSVRTLYGFVRRLFAKRVSV